MKSPHADWQDRFSQAGFTLIELLVTLLILGIVIGVISTSLIANTQLNSKTEARSQAVVAAQRVLDDLRTREPGSFVRPETSTVSTGGRSFTVNVTFCTATPNYCTDSAKQIRVDVLQGEATVFTAQTVFTSLNSTLGKK
ncbi:prepilin-type N-terminal cleavage/methylation domain-containing protein [Deinococcus frigens]|uniref:type IV pilus modification PilV family protein n=1 Tax=Deinococcus frigens TaxID=249403 RepID=UPI0004954831|nr:type II secretion system protein [Deinococcus frigens]